VQAAGDSLALCAEAPAEAARPRPGGPAHALTRLGAARPGWSAGHPRAGRSARSRRRPARRARTARRPAAAPRPARPPAAWPARRSARAPAAATHGGRARLPASVHFTSASHACEGVPTLAACRMLARRRPWPIANRAPSGRPADAPQGAQVSFSLPLCAEAPPQGLAAKRPATPQRERPSPAPQAWAPPSPCLTACAPGPGPPSGSPRRLAPLQPWAGANAERPCAAAMPGGAAEPGGGARGGCGPSGNHEEAAPLLRDLVRRLTYERPAERSGGRSSAAAAWPRPAVRTNQRRCWCCVVARACGARPGLCRCADSSHDDHLLIGWRGRHARAPAAPRVTLTLLHAGLRGRAGAGVPRGLPQPQAGAQLARRRRLGRPRLQRPGADAGGGRRGASTIRAGARPCAAFHRIEADDALLRRGAGRHALLACHQRDRGAAG